MDTENYMNEKSAFIAIVGRPNVGKSSILNRLLGTKLAIVSNKPQTTRTRIMGVWTEGETQLVFIDTPGLIKPKNSLGDYMVKSVTSSVADVDACLLVVEANTKISKADEELVHRFKDLGVPALLAINKIDLLQDKSVLMEQIAKLSALYDFEAVVPVSAQDGNGMDALREELIALAEPGGHFFSEDTLTDQPERVIASEIVREKILRFTDKEIRDGKHARPRQPDGDRCNNLLRTRHAQGHHHRQGRRDAEKNRLEGKRRHGALFRLQDQPAPLGKGEGGLAPAPADPHKARL